MVDFRSNNSAQNRVNGLARRRSSSPSQRSGSTHGSSGDSQGTDDVDSTSSFQAVGGVGGQSQNYQQPPPEHDEDAKLRKQNDLIQTINGQQVHQRLIQTLAETGGAVGAAAPGAVGEASSRSRGGLTSLNPHKEVRDRRFPVNSPQQLSQYTSEDLMRSQQELKDARGWSNAKLIRSRL